MDCIFCKIVNGEVPCHKIYEDDNFIAFLDINPLSQGNSLVIPKKHYQWVYDVPNFSQYWEVTKKITLATIKALNADSISYLTLGYEVPHAHIRVIPRFINDIHKNGIDIHAVQPFTTDQLNETTIKIKNLIQK